MVICDDDVSGKAVKTLLAQCGTPVLFTLPHQESSKSIDNWHRVAAKMLEEGFGAGDTMAVLGGGAACALSRFAAATFLGGISLCLFPTSATAQMDAAMGGKAALNLGGTVDVLETLYHPSVVVVDPDLLDDQAPRQMAAGLAEALKIALMCSDELFSILESDDYAINLERIIYLSLLYKKGIIERDEAGKGEGILLDFGHALGRGIQAADSASALLHGECVALGMLPMIENRTLLRKTRAILRRLGLPLNYKCDKNEVLRYVNHDKHREGNTITVARVKTAGHGYLEKITMDELALLYKGED